MQNYKIIHIINGSKCQIPNYWEAIGINYLSYDSNDIEVDVIQFIRLDLISAFLILTIA